MIEIVYQEKQEDHAEEEGYFHIPKNIRQIGDSPDNRKIYIEDYVYTHINRMVEESLGVGRLAILLGECHWLNGVAYYFIRSSFQVEGIEVSAQNIPFDDETWSAIYSTMKERFSGQEIIGWFLSIPDFEMEINDLVYRTHLEHFGENDKVLFAMDSVEKEESIYIYDGNQMEQQKGYYIYYEKNDPMQAYLTSRKERLKQEENEVVEDKAVRDFRKIINSKTEEKEEKGGFSLASLATVCLVGIVLIGGVTFLKNYEKMQSMEDLIANLQGNQVEEVSTVADANQNVDTNKDKDSDGASNEGEKKDPTVEQGASETPVVEDGQAVASNPADINSSENSKEPESTTTSGEAVKRYMVKKGDTLSDISKMYYGTIWKVADICEANNFTSEDMIYPGQIIVLP